MGDKRKGGDFVAEAKAILSALGGFENVKEIDACITRLRVVVNQPERIDQAMLTKLGAIALIEAGTTIQLVFGFRSNGLKNQIRQLLTRDKSVACKPLIERGATVFKAGDLPIMAPLSGKIIDLKDVPDLIFSERLLGDGLAIVPESNIVLSPIKGKVRHVFPTGHALVLTDGDLEILIHVGLETVRLSGEGFEVLVQEGDIVEIGSKLLKFDLDYIREHAKSIITPVIFMKLKGRTLTIRGLEMEAGRTMMCNVNALAKE